MKEANTANTDTPKLPTTTKTDDKLEPMTLSEKAKEWFTQHGLERFLRVAEAPLHDEVEKVAKKMNLEVIIE